MPLTCEVVAVGTELLLGQTVDTNSAWIGERLALAGIDSHFQTRAGDNLARLVAALRIALDRSDAVIVCGGLGPTHDDLTREAIAEVMGARLRQDDAVAARIRAMFESRGRRMPENNLRQAMVPDGARVIEQRTGTAPGLICPVGGKVIYAVPGVPHEMREMLERAVLPDLGRRSGERAVIVSRILRTWGETESGLAERLAPVIERLDREPGVTLAFLASGIEGLKVRLTAKAADRGAALARIAGEEAEVRAILGHRVFGVDDESMERVVARLCRAAGLTLAIAEHGTGGIIAHRMATEPEASAVLRGAVVTPAAGAAAEFLEPGAWPEDPAGRAGALAEAASRKLGADVGLATLEAGAASAAGTPGDGAALASNESAAARPAPAPAVWVGLCVDGRVEAVELRLPGDRNAMRRLACISALDRLRLRLLGRGRPGD